MDVAILKFTITGVQMQSEAARLHIRIDGVVGRSRYAAATPPCNSDS
jgi:hypothetical protein